MTELWNDRMTDRTKTICPQIFDLRGIKISFFENWIILVCKKKVLFTEECFVPSLVEIGLSFLISSIYFHHFIIISPWKRAWLFIRAHLNSLYQRILCAKFGLNWPRVLEKKIFKMLTRMYLCYFNIISNSPWKRAWPFIWRNLNPLYPRMLCAKFVLKLAHCFWRCGWTYIKFTDRWKDIFNFVNIFWLFHNCLPLKKGASLQMN